MSNIIVPCPLCNSSDFRNRYKLNGWQLVQCLSCDFVYVNPRPPIEIVEQGYRAPASQQHNENGQTAFNLTESYTAYYAEERYQKTSRFTHTIRHLLEITRLEPKACTLLDFGCGNGAFLEQALALGIDAYGCDIADWTRTFIRQRNLSARVCIGRLADASYQDQAFDIVHASAVIAHVYDPRTMLTELKQKLKPQGTLALMSTPNIESVFIRLEIDSFDGNVPLVHLNFFSKKTLLHFLQQNGFQPIYTRTHGVPLRLVAPPYFPKFMQGTRRYYQSDEELSIANWHDALGQNKTSRMLKKFRIFEVIKNLCNGLLNGIDGGAVIDVIAIKQE